MDCLRSSKLPLDAVAPNVTRGVLKAMEKALGPECADGAMGYKEVGHLGYPYGVPNLPGCV